MPREPQIDKAIELYAYFSSPANVFKTLSKEYGDACLTAHAISKIRTTYRQEILAKRKELEASIPLLDVNERWARLQEIVDGGLEGEVIPSMSGSYVKYDRTSALKALQIANDMVATKGTVNEEDDELIKSIVEEAYQSLKLEKPEASEKEIIDQIKNELGDKVTPYVDALVPSTTVH